MFGCWQLIGYFDAKGGALRAGAATTARRFARKRSSPARRAISASKRRSYVS